MVKTVPIYPKVTAIGAAEHHRRLHVDLVSVHKPRKTIKRRIGQKIPLVRMRDISARGDGVATKALELRHQGSTTTSDTRLVLFVTRPMMSPKSAAVTLDLLRSNTTPPPLTWSPFFAIARMMFVGFVEVGV